MSDVAPFLDRLTRILDESGVAYMIVGSVASMYHAIPRTTQDVDIMVALDGRGLRELLSRLPEESYYVSADAARAALRDASQFNVIDYETGWKADLIVPKDRPFSDSELERRQRGSLFGIALWFASAEDTILSKLEWAKKMDGSERQLRDVRGIVDAKGDALDRVYIERWAKVLRVDDLWRSV